MAPTLLMCLSMLRAESCRLVEYFSSEQGIKMPEQIVDDYNRVEAEFGADAKDFDHIFRHGNGMDIFQYKAGEELVASVCLVRETFYGEAEGRVTSRQVVLVYSMYVSEGHRGLGHSRRLLRDAADSLDRHYGLGGDFLLALHVDPKDRDMALAFSLYYNLNFRRGGFSTSDPYSKKYVLEEILGYRDPCDVIDAHDEAGDAGKYMVMVCRYPELCACERVGYDRLMEYGARLRGILQGAKAAAS